MQREYRGRVADEPNEWVYGYLQTDSIIYQEKEGKHSNHCGHGSFSVIPNSVGQWTGKYDVNRIKIFENDLVKERDSGDVYQVIFNEEQAAFILVDAKKGYFEYYLGDWDTDYFTVIGNSFELEDKYEYIV